jgi:hypothetical protein
MSLTIAQFAGGASENFVKSLSFFRPNAIAEGFGAPFANVPARKAARRTLAPQVR